MTINRKLGAGLKLAALLYLAFARPALAGGPIVSLCDVAADLKGYDGVEMKVEAQLWPSYHISYLSSESCPDEWFGFRSDKADTGEGAQLFRQAMETRTRMLGGVYDIEFDGEFHRFSPAEKAQYEGREGYFLMTRITLFAKRSR